ncbi:hypothetical protein Tco_0320948 [Tanacetum coccineum]
MSVGDQGEGLRWHGSDLDVLEGLGRNEPVKSDKQAVKPRMVTQSPKLDRKYWNGKMTQKLGLECLKNLLWERVLVIEKVSTQQYIVFPLWSSISSSYKSSDDKAEDDTVDDDACKKNVQKPAIVSTVKGNGVTAVTGLSRSSGNPQQALKYKGMFDSRCSRHMTGNKALLTDYQDINGGFFAFGGSTRGGKITCIEGKATQSLLVLVTKPHNKTPYELIIGRAPSISFMRPFGCPVTILNTLDHLGKFDGKAEEGFLVGSTRNNVNTVLKKNVDAGQTEEKNVSTQKYIVFPLWSSISSSSKRSDDKAKDYIVDDDACRKNWTRNLL